MLLIYGEIGVDTVVAYHIKTTSSVLSVLLLIYGEIGVDTVVVAYHIKTMTTTFYLSFDCLQVFFLLQVYKLSERIFFN